VSKTTILASGQITTTDALRVELREPDEFPATIFYYLASSGDRSAPLRRNCGAVARLLATAITKLAHT
jgi:hypothetical protein